MPENETANKREVTRRYRIDVYYRSSGKVAQAFATPETLAREVTRLAQQYDDKKYSIHINII